MRIERHFENRGRSTRRSGARTGAESFPIGSARFVEMNMGIDHAGKNRQALRIDFLARRTG